MIKIEQLKALIAAQDWENVEPLIQDIENLLSERNSKIKLLR